MHRDGGRVAVRARRFAVDCVHTGPRGLHGLGGAEEEPGALRAPIHHGARAGVCDGRSRAAGRQAQGAARPQRGQEGWRGGQNMTTVTKPALDTSLFEREDLLNGCQAVAEAVRLADVDVIAAYPIRPYTEVMDAISRIIADGKLEAEYIIADSEHSQFEIAKHASSVNARAFAGS